MGTELITIKSLATKYGLTFGPVSTSSIGVRIPLKTKLLKCIKNEIDVMSNRKTTEIVFKTAKVREIRFHRLIDNNELEVCVKYKGKKHGVDSDGEGGIKCNNDIKSLIITLNGLYELYKDIPEDNEFYAEDKK